MDGEHAIALGRASSGDSSPELGGDAPLERSSDIKPTLEAMARIVESKNPGKKCSILLTDDKREYIVGGAGPSFPDAYNKAVEGLRIGPFVGSCGTASFWNVPVVVEDIYSDLLWQDLREAATIAGVSACWSHPISASDGPVLGAVALYSVEPAAPEQHHMDYLELAAKMVALAVERDQLEEQLRQTVKMEAIGVLAGGVAHDFNNMLATIMGNAEIAISILPENGKATSMLQEIVTASVGASELCNQMLNYAGRGARATELVECNALVREIGGLLQVTLSKKASLEFDLQDGPLGVLADRSQLSRVMMNLITNASDAIGENEGHIVVGTRSETCTSEQLDAIHPDFQLTAGEYVRVWVSDSGAGMDGQTVASIFDPFFSTKSTGRGLGLAAVHGIMRSHKGAIKLDSAIGEGTTFSLFLPRAEILHGEKGATSSVSTAASSARILVVDDEPQVRKVLSLILTRAGYEVLQARDGVDALDVFRQEGDSIDCVLLDLNMPRLGGEEVFSQMRELRSDVCVILSSGFTEQEIMDRFHGAGLAGAVQKPAQMHVLLAKVADAVASVST